MSTTPPDQNDLPDDMPDASGASGSKKQGRQRRPTLVGSLPQEQGPVGGAELVDLETTGQEEATVAFVLTPELLARMGIEDDLVVAPLDLPSAAPADLPDVAPAELPSAGPAAVPSAGPAVVPSAGPAAVPSAGPAAVPSAAPADLPDVAPADLPDVAPADLPDVAPAELPSAGPAAVPSAGLPSSLSSASADEERTVAFVPPPELFAEFAAASALAAPPAPSHRHAGTEAYGPDAAVEPASPAKQVLGGHRHAATEAYSPDAPVADEVPLPAPTNKAPAAPAAASKLAPKASGKGKGVTLFELLKNSGSMNGEDAVLRMCKIAKAVQELHVVKQSHGALTPAHIRFVPDGDGAVELVSADKVKLAERFSSQYEAPEVSGGVQTETVTPIRSDVYALGCILFHMLTGKPPFRAKTPEEIRKRHAKFAVPAVRQIRADVEMPPALEVQLQRALKKRPADRPACAGDFAQAIAYATAEDDRGTVHFAGAEAKLLQELITQKTESHQAQQQLQQERRRTEAEKKAASEQKAHAVKEVARASEETARAEQEQRSARRSKKTWITIAVAGLILSIGAAGAFYALYEAEEIIIEKEVEKIVTQEKIVTHEKIVEKKVFVDGGTRVIYVEKDAGAQKKRRPHRKKHKPAAVPTAAKKVRPPPPKVDDGPAVF